MTKHTGRKLADYPARLLGMGRMLAQTGRGDQAAVLARQAVADRPDDPLIAAIARTLQSYKVPSFHHGMLRDRPRNAAYRAAIEGAARGRVVLDIGSGSGLLAMIAARAGAAHVHTCEMMPQLALTAREIIAANGLADRITVHAVHSAKLDRLRDLGGGADLIVSEILSNDVIGEGVLPALRHARAELAAPGALVIPESASVRVALAGQTRRFEPIGTVEGFDLSLFNRHVASAGLRRPAAPDFTLNSDPADLLKFDFRGDLAPEGRGEAQLLSTGGVIGGVAQWLRIDLADGIHYENQPGADVAGHWRAGYYIAEAERASEPGDAFCVHGWHDDASIQVWLSRD